MMSKIEMKLNDIIINRNYPLDLFIQKKSNSKIFGHRNRRELVNLLPIIMENTDIDNWNWMENIAFIQTDGFLDMFIAHLDRFRFSDVSYLMEEVIHTLNLLNLNEIQAKNLIDKILECDVVVDYYLMVALDVLVQRVNHGLEEYLIKKYIRNEKSFEACLVYFLNGEYSNLVYENIDFILEHIEGIDLFWLKKTMNDNGGVTIKVKKKIEEQVRENVLIMIKNLYLLGEKYKNFSAEDMQKMDTILDVVYLIIEDVCKNEQISISDMEILSSGAFSDVLRLGDKIVKIGYNRGTKKFPNNPYVVSMLLRKEIPINKDVSLFIEVNERVDTDTEVSDEELYQLYQKVRELHLIWVDVAVRNVGRLLKDNQIYWREELPITDERLGLQPYRGQGVLKKGELVILDNDLIFDEKDDSTVVYQFQTALQKEFEERYQRRIKNRSRSDAIMKVQDDTEFYEVVGRKR